MDQDVGVGVDDLVLQSVLQSRLPPPDLYPLHFRSLVSVAQVDDSAAVSSPTNCVVTLLHQQHNTDAQYLKPDLLSKHPRLGFILAPARPLLKLPHWSRTLSSL